MQARAGEGGGGEGRGGASAPLPGKGDPRRAREIHRGSSPEGLRWIARSSRTPAREPPGPSPTSSAKFAAPEASSKTPTDPVTHRPNANPRRPRREPSSSESSWAVEARYAARQRHARESRAAVRENDPVRAERRRRAEEAAAARLAEQDARRAAASAEEALLKKRGLVYVKALDSGGGRGTDGDDEKSAPGDGYGDGGLFEGEDRGRRVRAEAAVGPDGSRGG